MFNTHRIYILYTNWCKHTKIFKQYQDLENFHAGYFTEWICTPYFC